MSEHAKILLPHLAPVRFSRLKRMGKSPAHYRAWFDQEEPDSPAKRFGRLVHAVVLGGKYVVYDGERRGNAWKAFQAANADAEIVLRREAEEALRVAEAIGMHRDASELLRGGHEQELAWMSDGRACGARLDVIGDRFVTDLKTSASVEPGWFVRNATRMGYHAQMSWYMQAARIALKSRFDDAYVVAVEGRFPHVVTCFRLTTQALDMGDRLWRGWWEQLMNCERSDSWPPYALGVQDFDVSDNQEIGFDE